jgi:hypothetical protein
MLLADVGWMWQSEQSNSSLRYGSKYVKEIRYEGVDWII